MLSNKRATVYVVIGIAFLFTLVSLGFFYKRSLSVNEQLRHHFRLDANTLIGKLRNRSSGLSDEQIERLRKAIHILKNPLFDKTVVVFEVSISPIEDKNSAFVVMRYVDEFATVEQINYAMLSATPDIVGKLFLSPQELPPPEKRQIGIFSLYIYLRPNDDLPPDVTPYSMLDGKYYLVVPRTVFDNIVAGDGEFILLDHGNNILDKVKLKELDYRDIL